MLKIGFIGVGRIADMHYEGYKNNSNAYLYAICDIDKGLLNERTNQWEVERTYENYHDLLDDKNIDAVEIITPHHLHHQMVIDALDSGKHVSVQKPMSLNIRQANEMITHAEKCGKVFRVIENYRYHPPFSKAKSLIEHGAIGEPISIRIKSLTGNAEHGWTIPSGAQNWRSDPDQAGGGSIIFDHGQHIWSIARYIMGDVDSVFAFVGNERVESFHELTPGSLMDNPAMVSWKYKDANRYGSWESIYSDKMIVNSKYYPIYVWAEVTGESGILWVNNFIGQDLNRPALELYTNGEMTEFSDIESDYSAGFRRAGEDFAQSIITGKQSELTGMEGREVLRLSLAVIKSADERREVSLDEVID